MIKIVIIGFMILLILMTFVTEPKLSANYYTALIKSGFKLIGGIIKLGTKSIDKYKVKEINQTGVN